MDLSNKSLAVLLVVAIVMSLGGTIISPPEQAESARLQRPRNRHREWYGEFQSPVERRDYVRE